MLELTVYGTPAPQGSKKFVGTAKNGRGILVESSKKVKPWREAVKGAFLNHYGLDAVRSGVTLAPVKPIPGPVEVEMIFTMPKPKSAPKRKRTWPDRTPDLSKLVRSTEDALTDVGAWEDDARVIRCIAAKVFPNESDDALNVPGAVIRIRPAEASQSTSALNQPEEMW